MKGFMKELKKLDRMIAQSSLWKIIVWVVMLVVKILIIWPLKLLWWCVQVLGLLGLLILTAIAISNHKN